MMTQINTIALYFLVNIALVSVFWLTMWIFHKRYETEFPLFPFHFDSLIPILTNSNVDQFSIM